MKLLNFVLLPLFTFALVVSAAETTVTDQLEDVSVTVVSNGGQGSGVIKVRDGVSYVWTAGHVVADNRNVRTVVDSVTHSTKYLVTFDDVVVIRDIIEDGRLVGSVTSFAQIIKYSDADFGADLALLRIRKQNFSSYSAKFYLVAESLPVGESLIHVGSMRGHAGANSYTTGVLSQYGRLIGTTVYDQVSTVAQPGSSGCGVFTKDGRYVGMLVRGYAGTEAFNFISPIRRIVEWSKAHGVYWALDDAAPVDLTNTVVEDYLESAPMTIFAISSDKKESTNTKYPLLINREIHL